MAITVFAPLASGQTLYWAGGTAAEDSFGTGSNGGDNNFNTAANWSTVPPNIALTSGTQTVPVSTNIAIVQTDLNNGTIYDDGLLSGQTAVPVVINQTKQGNTVQGFTVSSYFSNTGSGVVDFNNSSGSAFIVAGTNSTSGDLVVDGGNTLNYAGPETGSKLELSNGLAVVGDNTFNFNDTEAGSGTLNITGGTFTFDAAGTATQMAVGYSRTGSTDLTFGSATGTVNEGGASSAAAVVTGSSLVIGYNGGSGTWTLSNGSSLSTGTLASLYYIAIGSNGGSGLDGTGGSGTLTINDTSTFNVGTAGLATPTDLQLGTVDGNAPVNLTSGSGTINQNGNATGATSSVNIAGTNTSVEIGAAVDGTGTYNLNGGNLNIGTNATDDVTFRIGAGTNATGTLTQKGGTLTVGSSTTANGTTFQIGSSLGTGVYTLSGGTATFYNAMTISSGGTLNLDGGVLNISAANFASTQAGVGTLNFGGGTLHFTGGTTFDDNYAGGALASGTVSAIDASVGTFTAVTIAQNLTGGGGIELVGTDGNNGTASTLFTLTGTNTYSGTTTVAGGTLTTNIDKIADSSGLNILSNANPNNAGSSVGTVNLSLNAGGYLFAGSLGGNGNLNLNFAGTGDTFAIENPSTFTGTIKIGADNGNQGGLQLFSGSFGNIGEGTGTAAGATVTIGGPYPIGINPSLATAPASGSVTIANATYTGLTTINVGFSLNVTGAGGLLGGVVNGGALNTASIGGDVNNSGAISVTGAAGIGGSVLSNSGSISTPLVSGASGVTSTGTFTGTSALGATTVAGNVVSSGSLSSATALPTVLFSPAKATFTINGTLTESGNINFRSNGIAADDYVINGAGVSSVGGTAHLSGFGNNSVGYTVVDVTNGGGTLVDNGLTLSHTTLFSGTLTQVGNSLILTTAQIPSSTFSKTPTERNVATAIDGFLTNPQSVSGYSAQVQKDFLAFANYYSGLTPGEFPAVQEQLTPTTLQYARNIAFENSTYLAERMDGVAANLRSGYSGLDTSAVSIASPGFGSGLGRSLGSLLASDDPGFHSAAPNGVNYYPGESGRSSPSPSASERAEAPAFEPSNQVISDTPNPYLADVHPGGPDTPKMSEFIGGDAVLADLNRDGTLANAPSSKGSYTAGGATAGVSFRVTNHFAAGVLFDYNHTDANTDSNGSTVKVDSYSPGVFATFFDKGFYADGLFSFGYNNYSNSRALPAFGTQAKSSPDGEQYVGNLDIGYDFHPDKAWVVGPTLGATYVHLDIDSIQETGAGLEDLAINGQSANSLRSRLGGHVLYQTYTGDVLLQPSFTAMWQHEYMDDASSLTSDFIELGSPSSFSTPTAAPSRDSALIGLGLTATLNNSLALYLNYLADVGQSDYFSQSVIGGVKARF